MGNKGDPPNSDYMSLLKPIEWRMNPTSVCLAYQNIDLKSQTGINMIKAILEYDRDCENAKIILIDKLMGLLEKPH